MLFTIVRILLLIGAFVMSAYDILNKRGVDCRASWGVLFLSVWALLSLA